MGRPPTCNQCRAVIAWYRRAQGGSWVKVQPTPVIAHEFNTVPTYPIYGEHLWNPDLLIEHLQLARSCSYAEARAEVDDLLWVALHHCHLTTTTGNNDDH